MRAVVQRVTRASVTVDDRVTGSIDDGLLVLFGAGAGDGPTDLAYIVDKIVHMRIFADEAGKMNLCLEDIRGGLLVVSQFTLYGDTRKGRRPSFIDAAPPELAVALYEKFVELARARGLDVGTGVFQAMMDVDLVNDGPVTLIVESRERPPG